jgi:plastocyanin
MRRHLSLVLVSAALVVAACGTSVGVAGAAVPRTSVRILSGVDCTPTSMYCFKKSAKTIVTGTKVVWKNLTIAPHTVTRCNAVACSGDTGGTGTDTGFGGSVPVGAKYKFIFHGTGTYSYYCTVHGYAVMHGTVTVTP